MKEYTPTAGRILVELLEPPKTSKGGIILPDIMTGKQTKADRVNRAIVLAVGPKAVKTVKERGSDPYIVEMPTPTFLDDAGHEQTIRPGDVVIFSKWTGVVDDREHERTLWIVEFDDVWAAEPAAQQEGESQAA